MALRTALSQTLHLTPPLPRLTHPALRTFITTIPRHADAPTSPPPRGNTFRKPIDMKFLIRPLGAPKPETPKPGGSFSGILDILGEPSGSSRSDSRTSPTASINKPSMAAFKGRSVTVYNNIMPSYSRLRFILNQNNVRKEVRANRYYEKPTVRRRREARERNRKRFAEMVKRKAGLIIQMKNSVELTGWFVHGHLLEVFHIATVVAPADNATLISLGYSVISLWSIVLKRAASVETTFTLLT
ncbi:hypothetical protein BC938DRAFT_475655 [Jimgerdemannia flammicorona]|uniref:Uncharacterized protein n=1 Tax=Jimgerdemannia flammicorona TaxID=994334 RepID=A0A433PQS6_9FUNG|nr:hypothetical protein BC938DRAFT_475655 [Jimgerdemannia flammicorona]